MRLMDAMELMVQLQCVSCVDLQRFQAAGCDVNHDKGRPKCQIANFSNSLNPQSSK